MSNEKIVYWKSKITRIEGYGKPIPSTLADIWATYGNKNFPEIEHITIAI